MDFIYHNIVTIVIFYDVDINTADANDLGRIVTG